MHYNFIEGEVLYFNKPKNWTSFDVVNKVRILITQKIGVKKIKVGHAGTLDPLADGLVILCTGRKTKQITSFQDKDKEYVAEITFGATTPSFDLETEIDQTFPYKHITKEALQNELNNFIGEQKQYPPIFSAKKINGKRAYENARKGIDVKVRPAIIVIKEINLLNFFENKCTLRIVCSKGTYIRSIANDLGKKLNSGAHLSDLRRTKIGDITLNDAITIKEFEKALKNAQ